MKNDVARLFVVSSEGGHAGPSSSWDYIHLVEGAIAHWQRRARPDSWLPIAADPIDVALFPDIGEGVLLPPLRPPVKQSRSPAKPTQRPESNRLAAHSEIARRIADKEEISEIIGHTGMSREAVVAGVRAIAQAMVDAELADAEALGSVHRQVYEIWRCRTWIVASSHPKLVPLAEAVDRLFANHAPGKAEAVWNSWLRCVAGRELSLDRTRPASHLIDFLLKAGVPRASMGITSAQQALPVPLELATHKLSWRRCQPRPGTPRYRLALVDRHIKSSSGKARQVSVTGLHWLFVLVGSVLISKEK